ncbi:hypothetical protein BC830DRAFT_30959 [Chytriomyces sp. MP71]|nr:hypothetical protein BC830DRAFT_30959 [Chytriomyces sp. MP71]
MHDPPKQANGSREKHDFGRPESPIQSKPTERSGMTRSGSPIEIDQRVARSRTRDAANRPEFPVERLPRTASSRTRTVPKPSTGQDKPSHSDDAVELTRLGDYARKPEARKRPESLVEVAGSDHPPRRMIPQSQDISSVSRRRDRSQSRPTSPLEHHCMDRGEGERKHSTDHDARDGPIARKNSSDAEVPRRRPSQTRQHGARGEDEMLPRSRSQRRFGDRSRERGNEETRESPVMRDARSRERERYHLTEEEQSQRRDRVMSPSRREVPRPDRPARSPHRQHSAPDDHRHHRGQSKSRDRKRIETPEPISAHHQRLLSPRRDHKRNSSYTLDKDDGFDANVGTQSDTGRYRQNRSRPTTPSSPEPEYHSRRKDRMLSPGPSRERHYAPTPSPSRHHGRAESNGRGRRDADDRRESPRRDSPYFLNSSSNSVVSNSENNRKQKRKWSITQPEHRAQSRSGANPVFG